MRRNVVVKYMKCDNEEKCNRNIENNEMEVNRGRIYWKKFWEKAVQSRRKREGKKRAEATTLDVSVCVWKWTWEMCSYFLPVREMSACVSYGLAIILCWSLSVSMCLVARNLKRGGVSKLEAVRRLWGSSVREIQRNSLWSNEREAYEREWEMRKTEGYGWEMRNVYIERRREEEMQWQRNEMQSDNELISACGS